MVINAVDVFCGSKAGNNPIFEAHTKELGYLLAEKNITIIYGGGNKGLMAAVANAALERNGKVVGIIPKVLSASEHQHDGLSELHIVDNMHMRKQMLYEKCDAAIILPGGYGTLDEVFEILTWNQLRIHNKKIFILNSAGFYDHMIAHINNMHQEGFLYGDPYENMTILKEPADLLAHL
ncbi:MAG: TIGR00730 family Rossman fold protein [Gloeobacteraceae cyanobacterium ES-bin-316]|nr:TIGR00730 family Rossman fold protein [Ferruginibacter sp.]